MTKKVGYARVSTKEQVMNLQIDALVKAGCDPIFQDHAESGAKKSRPEWDKCLESLQAGDALVVYSFSRAGRSTLHLSELLKMLQGRGVDFVSLSEGVDSSTPAGKMVFHMLAAIAEFERDVIMERCEAGRVSAKARGVKFGPPIKASADAVATITFGRAAGVPVSELMKATGLSRATVYRVLEADVLAA